MDKSGEWLTRSDPVPPSRPPVIAETTEPGLAREQKITPFDVEGGVDAEGRSLGM